MQMRGVCYSEKTASLRQYRHEDVGRKRKAITPSAPSNQFVEEPHHHTIHEICKIGSSYIISDD